MKKIKNIHIYSEVLSVLAILATLIAAPFFYLRFPNLVPTHWGLDGVANGWSRGYVAAFLFPVIILLVYLLMTYLPKIDPKKKNYEEFEGVYALIKTVIVVFLALMYFLSSLMDLGYNLRVDVIAPCLVGIIIIIIGSCLDKVKSNWFIGVRTPWTLSSEEVWKKTHHFSKFVFVIGGALMIISSFVPFWLKPVLFIISLVVIVILPVAYSYFSHRKIHGK